MLILARLFSRSSSSLRESEESWEISNKARDMSWHVQVTKLLTPQISTSLSLKWHWDTLSYKDRILPKLILTTTHIYYNCARLEKAHTRMYVSCFNGSRVRSRTSAAVAAYRQQHRAHTSSPHTLLLPDTGSHCTVADDFCAKRHIEIDARTVVHTTVVQCPPFAVGQKFTRKQLYNAQSHDDHDAVT